MADGFVKRTRAVIGNASFEQVVGDVAGFLLPVLAEASKPSGNTAIWNPSARTWAD